MDHRLSTSSKSSLIFRILYATLPDKLVIVGDFNFNFDINTDVHARRFRDMLDSHGLTQYVEVATHQEGHILDLIIACTYYCVVDTVMADLISNDCAVHCRIALRKPPFRRELKTYRKIKAINFTSFPTDIENSDLYTNQERSLEHSVTQYNDVLGDLLEKHAPLKNNGALSALLHFGSTTTFCQRGRRNEGWSGSGGCQG